MTWYPDSRGLRLGKKLGQKVGPLPGKDTRISRQPSRALDRRKGFGGCRQSVEHHLASHLLGVRANPLHGHTVIRRHDDHDFMRQLG